MRSHRPTTTGICYNRIGWRPVALAQFFFPKDFILLKGGDIYGV